MISGKRIFDFTVAVITLFFLLPFLLVLAVLVWIWIGHPVIFKQQRTGYKGHLFYIYKFRTMTERRDSNGNLLPDAERLTPFGKFLRSYSLDELPELINILRGEMSFVGPRPLLVEYLPLYSPEQARRHNVVPGLTGWAQVNGRNDITWPEKFKLDVWYVDHRSFWLDLKIIFMTVWKVFTREGVSKQGQVTTENFKGEQ